MKEDQDFNESESFTEEDLESPEISGSGDYSFDETEETKIRVGRKFVDIDHLMGELEEGLAFHLAQDGQSKCGIVKEYQLGHQKLMKKLEHAASLEASPQCGLTGSYGLAIGNASTEWISLYVASGIVGLMGFILIG